VGEVRLELCCVGLAMDRAVQGKVELQGGGQGKRASGLKGSGTGLYSTFGVWGRCRR
jgi:hypothetical protein